MSGCLRRPSRSGGVGIVNGQVYDPANGIDGQARDIWVKEGRIVPAAEIDRQAPVEIIQADGLVVMPGGVDIHSHIAGSKVNAGRRMCPEDHRADVWPRSATTRSGVGHTVPTTFVTGYRYLEMGYTTVMEAAMPPLLARHTHEELNDIPLLDKGAYTLMGNNRFLLGCLRDKEHSKARDFVAWLIEATRGYAIKIVSAGAVENWKAGKRVTDLDDVVEAWNVTPRQIILLLADISSELRLPHGPHIHVNRLGHAGNASTTIRTIQALEGRRAHLAHLQFASYGGGDGHPLRSGAAEVAEAVNAHRNLTVDVGQVVFGPTTTMTADAPLEHVLHQLSGNKWMNNDIEEETGGGVVPMNHGRRNTVSALQWCIGLELFLRIQDPWQVFLTTDHPNGGPFTAYPEIIGLLMDSSFRDRVLASLPDKSRRRTGLGDLRREFSLNEIAIVTRAGTARALGLKNKGHLGIGADADIAIYDPQPDRVAMFSRALFVVKGGHVVVRDGHLADSFAACPAPDGTARTLCVAPGWDRSILPSLRQHFDEHYTVSFDNYALQDEYVPCREVVPCT